MPFAIISNINERSSTRSFLDDPNERLDDCMRYCAALRPSPAALATIDAVMRRENALVPRLINWAEESTSNARLVLKWPGATSSVRAFTVEPATSVRQPRTIFFTRRDEDEPCYVDSFDPMYAALMWPLVCPDGAPPRLKGLVDSAGTVLRPAGALLDKEAKNIRQATLALMLQPERTSDGAFLLVPCQSPYGPSAPRVLRRFGRLELMGRLGDEVLVDRWLSALDARLHFVGKSWMQSRLLRRFDDGPDAPETEDDVADERRGTYLPPSEHGTPRYLRHCCGNALALLRQKDTRYLFFITVTTDISGDWPEVDSGLAQQNPTAGSNHAYQDPYDRAALHAEVFEAKVQAFLARLRSGTIFRNLGRPTVEVENGVRMYTFPMQTKGGGYIIAAVEDQDRGLGHIHIAYKPAKAPRDDWNARPRPNQPMHWVDEVICARIPDEEMLATFKLVLPAAEARAMLGVCSEVDSEPHGMYRYLRGVADTAEVLHPDVVANFGYGMCDDGSYDHAAGKAALLARLVSLVSGTPRGGTADAPDHWSLHPYTYTGGGKLIHRHHHGPHVPDAWCKRKGHHGCKDHYPKEIAAFTHMTEEGYMAYRRGAADIMVVPYNPWILLYFTSHINVELVCSPTNVILYLFKLMKYIHKGSDVNRMQLVADGHTQRGEQGSADGSTHRRDERRDEIREWRNCKTTCATQAYRRSAGHTTYLQDPLTEEACVHDPRRRDPKDKHDDALSPWEQYLARPRLSKLDEIKFDEFLRGWICASAGHALAEHESRQATAEAIRDHDAMYISKDGRTVYTMNDSVARTLREGTVQPDGGVRLRQYFYWERHEADAADRAVRLLRVPKSAGVRYYVRLLGKHVAARGYKDLLRDPTNPALHHESFEVACRMRGLLTEETEARDVLADAIDAGDSGTQLRSLVAQFLKEGFALSEQLMDDHTLCALAADLGGDRAAAFADIDDRLCWLGSSLAAFAPQLASGCSIDEVARERRIYADHAAQRRLADSTSLQLDTKPGHAEQSEVVRWGLCGARLEGEPAASPEALPALVARAPAALEVGVVHGDGGAGKTRTVKRLAAEARARGQIVLLTAATNLAATNYDRGMSTHALALLAGNGEDEEGNVTIRLAPAGRMTHVRLALLKAASIIVIDEFSNIHCAIVESFLRFLHDHSCTTRVLLVGDPQQIPPVLPGASREEVIDASVVSLPLYHNMQHMPLTKAYRQLCPAWARLVRSVGAGSAEALLDHALTKGSEFQRAVALPLVRRVHYVGSPGAEQRALEDLFGLDARGHLAVHSGGFRAVLCSRNDRKNMWNALVNERRARETGDPGQTYIASHHTSIEHGGDDGESLAAEALGEDDMAVFQNRDHSVPLGELTVREGDVMLLAKTLDKAAGLVKNARVVVVELRVHAIVVRLDRTDSPSSLHTIGRAVFAFNLKRSSPLKIVRTQLPLVHAWALTINRSQGQTLDGVLLDLRDAALEHGQAYVAISRVHTADELALFVDDNSSLLQPDSTRVGVLACVTYPELLRDPAATRAEQRRDRDCIGRSVTGPSSSITPYAPTTLPPAETPPPRHRRMRLADLVERLDDTGSAVAKRMRAT